MPLNAICSAISRATGKLIPPVYDVTNAKSYTYEEYANLFKNLWEEYIYHDKKPKLLGLTLTLESFLIETIHCIAPLGFWMFPSLPRYRAELLNWLRNNYPKIHFKIGHEYYKFLENNLEGICEKLKESGEYSRNLIR